MMIMPHYDSDDLSDVDPSETYAIDSAAVDRME